MKHFLKNGAVVFAALKTTVFKAAAQKTIVGSFCFYCSVLIVSATSANAQTLPDFLNIALDENPMILAAKEDLTAAEEEIVQARAAYLPQLFGDGQFGVTRSTSTSGQPSSTTEPFQIGVSATLPLYQGGGLKAGKDQAKAFSSQISENYRSTIQQVYTEIADAYYGYLLYDTLIETRKTSLDYLSTLENVNEQRLSAGNATRVDLALIQNRLAATRASLFEARASREVQQKRLVAATGMTIETATPFSPAFLLPPSAELSKEIADQENPDLLSARLAVDVAKAGTRSARSQRRPNIGLSASANQSGIATNFNDRASSFQVGVTLTIPISTGGALKSAVRQARHQASAANHRSQNALRTVRQRIDSGWLLLEANRQRLISGEVAVEAAMIGLEGLRRDNHAGFADILDVLRAQEDLNDAQENLAQFKFALRNTETLLLRDVGILDRLAFEVGSLSNNTYEDLNDQLNDQQGVRKR